MLVAPISADRPALLPSAAARRVSNQIARAFRGTYGARTGLRTIVRAVALQMIADGSTPEAVADVFERCVLDHPARLVADPHNLVTGEPHSAALVALARECVAEAAHP